MKSIGVLPRFALLWLGLGQASAGVLTYTSKASFLGDLQPGYYYTNFSGIPVNFDTPYMTLDFTNGAIGYTVSSSSGLFRTPSPDAGLGNWTASADLVVTFNTPNVRTVGGDFFLLNFNGNRLNGEITVTFSDGTTATAPSATSGAYGFFGISSDDPLSSMTISGGTGSDIYEQLANFYVSSTVSVTSRGLRFVSPLSHHVIQVWISWKRQIIQTCSIGCWADQGGTRDAFARTRC